MRKTKRLLLICLLCFNTIVFAKETLKSKFSFNEYPYEENSIDFLGSVDPGYLIGSKFSVCRIFSIENVNDISLIKYYPMDMNNECKDEAKIEINNQEFVFKEYQNIWIHKVNMNSINYNGRKYIFLIGNIGKYHDNKIYIFDITDPENILFIPPEEKFIEAEFENKFFGIYQGKLCFFLSTWGNLACILNPYYIDGASLKPLCDEKGNPYYVKYTHYFTENYERAIEITDEYIPK